MRKENQDAQDDFDTLYTDPLPNPAAKKQNVERYALLLAIFLVLLLLLSIVILLFQKQNAGNATHPIAYVYSGGKLIRTVDLSQDFDAYQFTVTSADGGENTIEVRPGSIGILSATCPDKLCVNQGFLSEPLFPLVCLPNQLVIEIREGTDTLDIIAY